MQGDQIDLPHKKTTFQMSSITRVQIIVKIVTVCFADNLLLRYHYANLGAIFNKDFLHEKTMYKVRVTFLLIWETSIKRT